MLHLFKQTYKQKRRLVVNVCDSMLAFSMLCCCFKKCCLTNRLRKAKVDLLEKGADRLEQSLDVVKMIRLQDIFRNLISANLDRPTRLMLLN